MIDRSGVLYLVVIMVSLDSRSGGTSLPLCSSVMVSEVLDFAMVLELIVLEACDGAERSVRIRLAVVVLRLGYIT